MELSIIEFFIAVQKREVFFVDTHYCIFGVKIFPFFFCNHLKTVLRQCGMSHILSLSLEELLDQSYLSRQDLIYQSYEEGLDSKPCLIISIQEKHQAEKLLSLVQGLSPDFYYVFFLPHYTLIYQKQLTWFNLEKVIENKERTELIVHLQSFLEEEKFKEIYTFLQSSGSLLSQYSTIEYILKLFAYLPCIKKNRVESFLTSYIKDMSFAHTPGTIFDLATAFFQKKRSVFYSLWFYFKEQYSFEFWYYFWVDQIWYSSLALIHRDALSEVSFFKKVNKWFLKYGVHSYALEPLFNAFYFLYRIEYLHKKYNHSIENDLEAFFIFWFQ